MKKVLFISLTIMFLFLSSSSSAFAQVPRSRQVDTELTDLGYSNFSIKVSVLGNNIEISDKVKKKILRDQKREERKVLRARKRTQRKMMRAQKKARQRQ